LKGIIKPVDRIALLDSGPLGLACCKPSQVQARRCQTWLDDLEANGFTVMIPAIADFEVRRELLRVRAASKLKRLADLRDRFAIRDITTEALERAAEFWATLRRAGIPTAGNESLDADAILAGVAATTGQPGDSVIVATSNVRHLARFSGVDARPWETIV
jgi:predicted nucleic acid-binding protein